jgi:hypothetical protein
MYFDLRKESIIKDNDCKKKYSTYKEQSKCTNNKVLFKKISNALVNNLKCNQKHCPRPEEKSKKISSNLSTKKSKTSHKK